MSRALQMLVHDLVDAVADCVDYVDGDLTLSLTDSERRAFELKWEQKFRAALTDEDAARGLAGRGILSQPGIGGR